MSIVHITIEREEDYYFDEADIKHMAEEIGMSVQDCEATLLGGEFERSELIQYCSYCDGTVTNYQVVKEEG